MDDLALHGFHKGRIFTLWVYDNHIGVGVGEDDVRHFLLCRERLACTRHAEDKGVTIEQMAAVGDYHVLGDNILPVINVVLMVDFLHPKGDKYRKALRGEGAESVNLPHAKGQGGRDKDGLLKIRLVQAAVVDGDFRGRPAVEGIEQLRVFKEAR